jgi:hypothetical protein
MELLSRITDPACLEEVISGSDSFTRRKALDRLIDQPALARLALAERPDDVSWGEVVWGAVGKLTDKAALVELAGRTTTGPNMLRHVRERLSPENARAVAEVAYRRAAAQDTVEAYHGLTEVFPGTPQAAAATAAIRRLRFVGARKADDAAAYAAFAAQFPSGPESAEARRRLAARSRWEKARRLGELAVDMLPRLVAVPLMGTLGVDVSAAKPALEQFRVLLEAGADPAAVRIAGETPVPADRPGLPLLGFLEANGLTEAARLVEAFRRAR